jgi:FkbM family methyltransferase
MESMVRISGSIASELVAGEQISFFIFNEHDVIQRCHARGIFYETEELAIISDFFSRGSVFVDIGANVGNHTIYVCKYLHPSQAILFEPNPQAIPILQINLALNGLQRLVDLTHLGVGLSDVPGKARAIVPPNNLGATRLELSDIADGLPLIPGDAALMQRRVDFIKMDVEGMEMKVLRGLDRTIAKWRPSIFIEVDQRNAVAFQEWARGHDYITARTYRRYPHNENYMIVPIEAPPH